MTYRTKLHDEIEKAGIYSKLNKDGFIKLDKGFYKKQTLASYLYGASKVNDYKVEDMINPDMYRASMTDFAKLVKRSRQAVRNNIISGRDYIVLKQGKYSLEGLYKFLNT